MTLHLGLFLFTYSHYKLIYQCTVNFYVFNAGLNKLNVISRKPLRDITASQQNQFGAINVELSSHNNQTLSLPKRGRPKQILSTHYMKVLYTSFLFIYFLFQLPTDTWYFASIISIMIFF
jgi:hypothetical protein